jgi:ATP-dependent Clp protease ATP-binding subunit ClpC
MLEKYTQKARMAIFHAREETSRFGTPRIESEQLLLGLLAADKSIFGRYLGGRTTATEIREAIVQATEVRPPTPISVDIPLSNECQRILRFSAEESMSSGRQDVDTEDLLLGILREQDSFAARLLVDRGLDLEKARRITKEIKPRPHD